PHGLIPQALERLDVAHGHGGERGLEAQVHAAATGAAWPVTARAVRVQVAARAGRDGPVSERIEQRWARRGAERRAIGDASIEVAAREQRIERRVVELRDLEAQRAAGRRRVTREAVGAPRVLPARAARQILAEAPLEQLGVGAGLVPAVAV